MRNLLKHFRKEFEKHKYEFNAINGNGKTMFEFIFATHDEIDRMKKYPDLEKSS